MYRHAGRRLCRLGPSLQQARALALSPVHHTVIVKRVHKPPLVEMHGRPIEEVHQHLIDQAAVNTDDDKWLIYEIEEKAQPHHDVKLILLRNVDDYGVKGQVVSVPFNFAHTKLLLPGFAVYHTEENLALLGDMVIPEDLLVNSSETARQFVIYFSKRTFDVCMSGSTPWTMEKWHIKASLRRHFVWLTEDQISIPGGEISGPDSRLENKEFIAVITINSHEKLKVRCRLHHLESDGSAPSQGDDHWHVRAAEPVWEHERTDLLDMNRAPPSKKQRENKALAEEVERFERWRLEREERLA